MVDNAVVLLTEERNIAEEIAERIRASNGEAIVVDSPMALVTALDQHFPVLALVDMGITGEWLSAVERCKLRPHTKQIPIHTFGNNCAKAVLRAARKVGVDHIWQREQFLHESSKLIERHISPPITFPIGWDDPLSEQVRLGLEEFNRGDYFEQHELLEAAWIAEQRPIRGMYQGILQIGLAFYQIERGNWQGALKMFRRGLPKLRTLPPRCQGIAMAEFRATAEAIHREVTELGPERLHEFDCARFPQIDYQS